jgi:hypothetical protein
MNWKIEPLTEAIVGEMQVNGKPALNRREIQHLIDNIDFCSRLVSDTAQDWFLSTGSWMHRTYKLYYQGELYSLTATDVRDAPYKNGKPIIVELYTENQDLAFWSSLLGELFSFYGLHGETEFECYGRIDKHPFQSCNLLGIRFHQQVSAICHRSEPFMLMPMEQIDINSVSQSQKIARRDE